MRRLSIPISGAATPRASLLARPSHQGQARHRVGRSPSRQEKAAERGLGYGSRPSTPRPPGPARPEGRQDLGRQVASKRLPACLREAGASLRRRQDARVLTCTIPRYVGRPCVVVRLGARRAVMLDASQAPGNAAGGRARPPCGSRFPPPRGVGNALRCQGIAVTPPPAEETGNAILRAVESCKGILASRCTPFLACRPISAVPHLSMVRTPG